jgi:spermidine/putrescine transport system permease protein
MSVELSPTVVEATAARPRGPRSGGGFTFGALALPIYSVIALVFLLTPIVYTFVFSFNDSVKSNIVWVGFTLDNWTNVCDAQGVCAAFGTSILVGVVATVIATALGTLMAIALVRYRFRARSAISLLLFLPMATPEVVLAASLLTLYLNLGLNLGFVTIVIAHVMFCISFVVVAVKARIASLDPRLEQAAMDLYANEVETFRRVTLPLVAPGIAGAALLAFSLSFDDYIITTFTSGAVNTFPKFVYVSAQRGIPAQAYVIGTFMFLLAFVIVVGSEIVRSRRARISA